jgi:type IV pilus assembly protein PilW
VKLRQLQSGRVGGNRGFTLIELMISLTIGLVLLGGMLSFFSNSSNAYAELKKSAEHTGSGSMAMWTLTQDINHAGYYGEFYTLPGGGAALPDPCIVAPGAIYNTLAYPIQGYDAPLASPLACLSDANFVPGTDILVVRYAEFTPLAPLDVPVTGEVYLQSSTLAADVQVGAGGSAVGTTKKANGTLATIFKKDGISAGSIRKLGVHIYFIAPCSVPADGTDTCTGPADDGGSPIPTLKRLELTAVAGAPGWKIAPMVEGIRNLQIDYGIDSSPPVMDPSTNQFGDGAPDAYVMAPALADWTNVVSVRISFIAVSSQLTSKYVDSKTYSLGLAGVVGPFNDSFKKHLFSGAARLADVSGRREIPQ